MKRPILVAGLCLTLVGIGCVGVRHEASSELKRGVSSLYAHLPPDVTFTYAKAYPRVLSRGAGFTQVRISSGNTVFTADQLFINAPSGVPRTGLRFTRVMAFRPRVRFVAERSGVPVNIVINARDVHLHNVRLPALNMEEGRRKDLKTLLATQVGRLTIDRLDAQMQERVALDPTRHDRLPAEISGNKDTLKIDTLNLVDVTQNLAQLEDARNIRLSRDEIPHGGSHETSQLHFDLHIDHMRHIPLKAYDAVRARLGLPLVPAATFLCAGPRQVASIGTTEGHLDQWRLHFDGFTISTREMGAGFESRMSETPGFIEFPDGQPDARAHRANFHLASYGSCTPAKGDMNIALNVAAPDLVDYAITAALVTAPLQPGNRSGSLDPRIASTHMTYRDHGLLSIVLRRLGAPEGVSEDAMRSELATTASLLSYRYPELKTLSEYIGSPNGQQLVLDFKPQPPLSLWALTAGKTDAVSKVFSTSWHLSLTP